MGNQEGYGEIVMVTDNGTHAVRLTEGILKTYLPDLERNRRKAIIILDKMSPCQKGARLRELEDIERFNPKRTREFAMKDIRRHYFTDPANPLEAGPSRWKNETAMKDYKFLSETQYDLEEVLI